MPAGFLILATQPSAPQAPSLVLLGPALLFIVILVGMLIVAVAIIGRQARRRLADRPTQHPGGKAVDPWAEAGKRLGRPAGGDDAPPADQPEPPGASPGGAA